MNRQVVKQSSAQAERYEREVIRVTKGKVQNNWLTHHLKESKVQDMISLIDTMARIGSEENKDVYENVLGRIIDLVDAIYYAQNHRKVLHMGKYKALLALIEEEIRRDVNREPGQVLFTSKGELFLRTMAPEPKTEVK